MSANTARKYLRQDNVTEQKKTPHTWRTRADPLEAIWPEAVRMLRDAPELEAKALFEHLSQRHPGMVKSEVLRTFQHSDCLPGTLVVSSIISIADVNV